MKKIILICVRQELDVKMNRIELSEIQFQFLCKALGMREMIIDFENTTDKEFMECYFTTKKKFKLELIKLEEKLK